MAHAIRIHKPGGPDELKWESVEVGEPGAGQVKLKQHAIGVNYIDVYQRSGLYKMPLPFVAGTEAQRVDEVGPDPPANAWRSRLVMRNTACSDWHEPNSA